MGEGEGSGDGIDMKAKIWSNSLADELRIMEKQEVWGSDAHKNVKD